jgi:hypothetical protein
LAGKTKPLEDWQVETLERCAAQGVPTELSAKLIGVPQATLFRRLNEFPDLADRLLKSKATARGKLLQTAFDMATVDKNPTMVIFLLKTQIGLTEDKGVNRIKIKLD